MLNAGPALASRLLTVATIVGAVGDVVRCESPTEERNNNTIQSLSIQGELLCLLKNHPGFPPFYVAGSIGLRLNRKEDLIDSKADVSTETVFRYRWIDVANGGVQ